MIISAKKSQVLSLALGTKFIVKPKLIYLKTYLTIFLSTNNLFISYELTICFVLTN